LIGNFTSRGERVRRALKSLRRAALKCWRRRISRTSAADDGAGTEARVFFTIRRSNIANGSNEEVFSFDSNAQPPGDTSFHPVMPCRNKGFDFSQYTYDRSRDQSD
jgi:hypothetical protein